MKALLELGGRSPGGTRRQWCTAGEGQPTVPGQLAGRRSGEPGGRLVAGRFRLRSLLGRGGMGRVWLADDELLDRPVAVKQLLLFGLESAEMRAQAWACALREARAAARVDHTGAVRIYDIVQENGCPWIVMEPLPSRTLQQALNASGPLPVRQVTRIGLRLVDVLQATHRAGLVHRDVTPGNVHLCGPLRPVIEGLLAKDPGRRLSASQARAALQAIQREHDTAQVQTSWIYASPAASAPSHGRRPLPLKLKE